MVFAFRQKEYHRLTQQQMRYHALNAYDELLPDDIGNKMFLGRIDVIGKPEYPYFIKERKDEVADGPVDTTCFDEIIQDGFKTIDIEVHHTLQHIVYQSFLLRFNMRKRQY